MNYAWKILDIYADGEKITSGKYHCAVFDGENTVETELGVNNVRRYRHTYSGS